MLARRRVVDVRDDPFALAAAAAAALTERTGRPRHDVAVVLGSGWASAAELLEEVAGAPPARVDLRQVPGFPHPTVEHHRATAHSLAVGERSVLVLAGRVHLYEGRDPAEVVHGVRTAAATGCRVVVLTNAAGSIDPAVAVGTPVLIADHLNLTGRNPIVGLADRPGAPRFPDLSAVYSPRLRALARHADPTLTEGVYAGLLGPSFETPAEIRALAALGADLVGMSTVLEAIAAAQLGVEVLGLSLVTNPAAGTTPAPVRADDVFAAARAAVPRLAGLLADLLRAPRLLPGRPPAAGPLAPQAVT
ncbi:MAG: purine-nucleoside phosphorylase [Acidimicrobiales bacterium]|nr:purine-nucleoside phosphorylase [Acidimicrobiales bacterium]